MGKSVYARPELPVGKPVLPADNGLLVRIKAQGLFKDEIDVQGILLSRQKQNGVTSQGPNPIS